MDGREATELEWEGSGDHEWLVEDGAEGEDDYEEAEVGGAGQEGGVLGVGLLCVV